MTRQRIMTIFGTRPEAIKMFPVVNALRAEPTLDVRVCVTAQHRAMLDQVLALAGIVPDIDLDLMRAGQSLDQLSAALLTSLGPVLDAEKPDRIVVQGDTATAMIGALSGYYRKIPVAHVEAGLRSGDNYNPWPEEVNRKVVGSIADLHFAPTRTAGDALRREGIDPATIHETGNTVIDALLQTRNRLQTQPNHGAGLDPVAARLKGKRIVAVTSHRRENFHAMTAIAEAVARLAARDDVAVVFPVHPNPNVRSAMDARLRGVEDVEILEPLDYPHFVRLLDLCDLVLTDSGGVQEEAPALGKPVIVMRETTERPEGVAAGTALLVGTDPARIVRETFRLLDDASAYDAMAHAHSPYGDGHASTRIAGIIARAHRS
jgi:UDP-N-acetylglucosamine 2-epimerase (non-hydrolysing)